MRSFGSLVAALYDVGTRVVRVLTKNSKFTRAEMGVKNRDVYGTRQTRDLEVSDPGFCRLTSPPTA